MIPREKENSLWTDRISGKLECVRLGESPNQLVTEISAQKKQTNRARRDPKRARKALVESAETWQKSCVKEMEET